MTTKQLQIQEAALQLFSEEGYHATSTSKVAKKANVSEGLIFRHFKNKEGLLDGILKEGSQRTNQLFAPILNEEEPKQVLKKTLEMPFNIKDTEFEFWKIQFRLKWELELDSSYQMKPLEQALIVALTKLRYKNPVMEAQLIMQYLEGISSSILKNGLKNEDEFKKFLFNKYHIE